MKLTVTNVDKVTKDYGVQWRVTYFVERNPGEEAFVDRIALEHSKFVHAFPEERILSLAEEYDLDPNDMDSLMDVLLTEPFMDENDEGPRLFSGASRREIKEAHLRRSVRAKLAVKMSTRGIRNPLEMIRSTPVSAQAVRRLAEIKERR